MARSITIILICLLAVGASFAVGYITAALDLDEAIGSSAVQNNPFDAVLDGDTIVDGGRAVHLLGLDAPELGPWAECWAEAALGGVARDRLQAILREDRGWHLSDVRHNESGRVSGRIVDRDGYDIAEDMRVYGHAAMTNDEWDWCGTDANLHNPVEGETPPMGPALWWPSGRMFDARAGQ